MEPSFNGSAVRVITYKDGCWVTTKQFYSPPEFYIGYSTDIEIGTIAANTGDQLLIVIEGVNDDIQYSFYTTLEAKYP